MTVKNNEVLKTEKKQKPTPPKIPYYKVDKISKTINLRQSDRKWVIGQAGETVSKLRKTHSVEIMIPDKSMSDEVVTIKGLEINVNHAIIEIRKIVEKCKPETKSV